MGTTLSGVLAYLVNLRYCWHVSCTCALQYMLLSGLHTSVYYTYLIMMSWLVGWFAGHDKKGICVGKKMWTVCVCVCVHGRVCGCGKGRGRVRRVKLWQPNPMRLWVHKIIHNAWMLYTLHAAHYIWNEWNSTLSGRRRRVGGGGGGGGKGFHIIFVFP